MTLPNFYNTVSANSIFAMWDGFSVANPNEVTGRLLLIGVYDLSGFPHFDPVTLASPSNISLEFVGGNIVAKSTEVGTLEIDGVIPKVNDRVLLFSQTDDNQNGIYNVVSIGGEDSYFELNRVVDSGCSGSVCTVQNNSGKTVFVESGNTMSSHTLQLMRYVCNGVGNTPQHYVDLTEEGFYTNSSYGLRLIDSIDSSQITSLGNDRYTINIPNFISQTSPRLLKILVPYNINIQQVMKSLLDKNIVFNLSTGANTSNNGTNNNPCII